MHEIILIVFITLVLLFYWTLMWILSLPVGLLQNLMPKSPTCERGGECKQNNEKFCNVFVVRNLFPFFNILDNLFTDSLAPCTTPQKCKFLWSLYQVEKWGNMEYLYLSYINQCSEKPANVSNK